MKSNLKLIASMLFVISSCTAFPCAAPLSTSAPAEVPQQPAADDCPESQP